MNRIIRNTIFVLWLLGIPHSGYSQTFDFENYTVKEGLAQSNVNAILQDRDGYICLATDGGLSRFDGKAFHNFSVKDNLAETKITCMMQLPSGEIWLGHSNGQITVYDDGIFKPVLPDSLMLSKIIYSMQYDKTGTIWICTIGEGAVRIKAKTKSSLPEFKIFSINEGLSGNVYKIYKDKNGKIFSISELGIRVLDETTKKFIPFKPPDFLSYEYTCMTEDNTGQLWFGTYANGLVTYHPITGKVNHYTKVNGLSSDFISCIYAGSSGSIWAGTWGGGVCIHNGNSFKILDEKSGLGGNKVRCIMEDREKNMWIGLHDRGASYYKGERFISFTTNDGLANNMVNAVVQDARGRFWFGSNAGISVYNPSAANDQKAFVNILQENAAGKNQVMTLKKSENHIIAGTYDGDLVYINSSSLKSENYFKINSFINTIEFVKEDKLWIGTVNGIIQYDPFAKILEPLTGPGITGKNIACLFRDSKNRMWIGMRDGGLAVYDGKNFKKFTDADGLTHNSLTSVCEDSKNIVWIGSEGGGVFKYDGNRFTNFTSAAGLFSDYVTLLLPAGKYLWIGTNLGLSRFDPSQNKFVSYSRMDGFKAIETRSNAGFRDRDDNLWFGTINGVTRYNPLADSPNYIEPLAHITDFEISSVKQNLLPNVKLNHKQNDIRINFIALSFTSPHKNRYQYILEGFDDDWKITEQSYTTYPNLPPGEYTFKVTATNGDGVRNNYPQAFSFIIMPPFIKTWWFRIPAILFIMTIIYFYYRTRLNAIRAEKQKELAEQAKYYEEQFLANMSHEIRTPLNAAIGMTNLLLQKNPRPDQLDYLNAMKQSSQNLLVIINDILDLSKIQAGKIELEQIPFKLSEVMTGVYNTLRFKSEEKKLQLITVLDDKIPEMITGDPVRLNQILINLAGNAIKFTDKGSVTISCHLIENENYIARFEFKVSDTGIGIPEDKLGRIFESFSQASADTTRKYGGTGLGLSISKNLIELHEGKILVNSKLNEGTVFSFIIPYKISAEQKIDVQSQEEKDETIKNLTGLKVLLAEDNPFNQMVASDTLHELIKDVEVEVAVNGQEVIEMLQLKAYDIILMDIQMPVMDGIEATLHIRKKMPAPLCGIKIIALSAGATKAEVDKCYKAGVNDYIAKPFEPGELLSKLGQLFIAEESK